VAWIAFQTLEHLVAAHAGHQKVQQDEIERFLLYQGKGRLSARCRGDVMRVPCQPARQQIPVGFMIVDDQDSAGVLVPRDESVAAWADDSLQCREHGRPGAGQGDLLALSTGEFDEVVDAGEQALRRVQYFLKIVHEGACGGCQCILDQHFAIALEGGQGGPKVVAQLAAKFVIAGVPALTRHDARIQ
jgi:hypothetical protein